MKISSLLQNGSRKAPTWSVALAGALILAAFHVTTHWIHNACWRNHLALSSLNRWDEPLNLALNHYRTLDDLKEQDVAALKAGLSNTAQSKRLLYEAGLSLQEEKRLLENQWEIMTTYFMVDMSLARIFLMRGDQPLASYAMNYVPQRAFGGIPDTLPSIIRIVSKERFANPERGQSEMVDGKLQWVPPQVGTSLKSNALGEFVLFTNSKLILHSLPNNLEDHEKYAHICLGLSRETARKLYRSSFIGTKIIFSKQN